MQPLVHKSSSPAEVTSLLDWSRALGLRRALLMPTNPSAMDMQVLH